MSKESLITELLTLPNGYQEHINTPLPPLPSPPADVDAAQIVCGQLAQYLLDVFGAFEGLHLLKVPAHMAELNQTNIRGLLASLEVAAASTNSRITMIAPTNGGTYYGAVTEIRCTSPGAIGIAASTATGSVDLSLDEQSGEWSALWPFAIGSHHLTVVARYESGEEESLELSFSVGIWPTYPASGEAYASPLDHLEISTGADTDRVTEASISIAGQTYALAKEAAAWAWREAVDLISGEVEAVLTLTIDGETIEDILYFTIHEG